MDMEITLPDVVPAMTLPNVTFFPRALLPLHIFEPRYREMLRDVLATRRIFAVLGLDETRTQRTDLNEPPHRIASVGIIRACQKSENGTSNLLLQGLWRVEVVEILTDQPYRRVRIRALASVPLGNADSAARLREELNRLIALKQRLGAAVPVEMTNFLRGIDDPETFVDLAAFSLCENAALRQKLLETLDIHRRLELFGRQLRSEIRGLRLQHRLQGRLPDHRISDN